MKRLLYIIGYPGAGKTSALREALDGAPEPDRIDKPFWHKIYPGGIVLGRDRAGGFGGTDALPMNVQPAVLQFMAGLPAETVVVAEGDRLGNDSFFTALGAGWSIDVALLQVPRGTAAGRRMQRGSQMNPIWIRGRETKVDRLADRWRASILPGSLTIREVAAVLRQYPQIKALRGEANA